MRTGVFSNRVVTDPAPSSSKLSMLTVIVFLESESRPLSSKPMPVVKSLSRMSTLPGVSVPRERMAFCMSGRLSYWVERGMY